MATQKEGGWFRRRSYNHLDYPLDYPTARKIVCDPEKIAKRQFLPMIGYTDEKRRFRTDNSNRAIPRSKRPVKVSIKKRDIRYAAHGDAAVYQYYAFRTSALYEDFLATSGLGDSIIGYRSGKGSNIDMAAEVFSEIAVRGDVAALCFDIEDFFPSISHAELKLGFQSLLGGGPLPPDWYAIFRSITKFSWIDLDDLARVEGFNPKRPPFPLVQDINCALDHCRGADVTPSFPPAGIRAGPRCCA